MTARQHRSVQSYVNRMKAPMGLTDWQITVERDEPDDDDAFAQVFLHFGRKSALIHFSDEFFDATRTYQRHVVIHELIHVCCASEEGYVFDILPRYLTNKVGAVVTDAFRHHHEYAVDHMATIIAQMAPLPNFPRSR